MLQNNLIYPVLLLVGTMGAEPIQNDYVQYGFLGILLTILIWYSRNSYKENVKRETANEAEKEKLVERYEKALECERQRYHELHLELMAFLKTFNSSKNDK